ncbi:MAG TPA: amidohydrolase family protein, partial [Bacillota bacterium]
KFRNKPNFTAEEIAAITAEAHARGARVAAHATTVEGVRRAVLAGVDTVEHGPNESDPEVARLMADRGVCLVPTPLLPYRSLAQRKERGLSDELVRVIEAERRGQIAFLQDALEAGVTIAFGTDDGMRPPLGYLGRNAIIFQLLVEAGCSNRQALEAATVNAAQALGVSDRVGRLRPGVLADCLVLRKNPLDDVRVLQDPGNLVRVYKSAVPLAA